MCNAYKMRKSVDEIAAAFSQLKLPLRFPEGPPNLEPRDEIRITDTAPILRAGEGSIELVQRRWSWPGPPPRRKPVFNYVSEGRRFAIETRCAILTDGFYEFTDPEDPKAKRKDRWLFTLTGEPWFCIAGIWRTSPEVGQAWTMLTTEPGPDIQPFHDRQVVVLSPGGAVAWLQGASEAELLRPLPEGSLAVERAAA